MVDPSKDSGTKAEDSPSTHRSASVPVDSSPVTPGRLVYVRRRLDSNPNVIATDSQPKHPPKSSVSLGAPSAAQGDWEDRYHQLQVLLNKLDESDPKDYVQMLRSVPSLELSRHAVQLERRSIQLSVEEAKEMQRVASLNVLGRSLNHQKSPANFRG